MTHALQLHPQMNLATLIASDRPAHASPELAAAILRSSQVFSAQLPATTDEAAQISEACEYLSKPATRKWIAGRVVTLLSQYFAPNMDEGVSAAIADDWCAMLDAYPAWAIANACRWWMGRENPHRNRRPLPGDIQDRCCVETGPIRGAQVRINRFSLTGAEPEEREFRPPTPEEIERRKAFAAEVLRRFAPQDQISPKN